MVPTSKLFVHMTTTDEMVTIINTGKTYERQDGMDRHKPS